MPPRDYWDYVMPTATPTPMINGTAEDALTVELWIIGLVAVAVFLMVVVAWMICKGRDLKGLTKKLQFFPIRPNILIIAGLIWAVCIGIIILIGVALARGTSGNSQFVIGALIGLLSSGITGLVGLGTTLLTEGKDELPLHYHDEEGKPNKGNP